MLHAQTLPGQRIRITPASERTTGLKICTTVSARTMTKNTELVAGIEQQLRQQALNPPQLTVVPLRHHKVRGTPRSMQLVREYRYVCMNAAGCCFKAIILALCCPAADAVLLWMLGRCCTSSGMVSSRKRIEEAAAASTLRI